MTRIAESSKKYCKKKENNLNLEKKLLNEWQQESQIVQNTLKSKTEAEHHITKQIRDEDLENYRRKKQMEKEREEQEQKAYTFELNRLLAEKTQKEREAKRQMQENIRRALDTQVVEKNQSQIVSKQRAQSVRNLTTNIVPIEQTTGFKQKTEQVKMLEHDLLTTQYEESKKAKAEQKRLSAEQEKAYMSNVVAQNKAKVEKEVQAKLRMLEETNRALLNQISDKMKREKADQAIRRSTAEAYLNPRPDKVIRAKTSCKLCPKLF